MKMIQKSLTFLVYLVVSISLVLSGVACSTSQAEDTPTVSVAQEETNAIITFSTSRWERALYEPLVEQFNRENPEITVQLVETDDLWEGMEDSTENYWRVLASAADVSPIYIGAEEDINIYFRGLQPLIDAAPDFDTDDFWPGLLQGCQDAEGRVLGVPMNVYINGLYFNKAAFDDAGLPYPQPGWTYADFQETVQTLAYKEGDKMRYGYADRGFMQNSVLAPLVEARLATLNGELDGEALLETVQWYIDLAKDEAIHPIQEFGEDDWEEQWQNWETMFKSENRPVIWAGGLAETIPGADYIWDENDPFAGMAIQTEGFVPYPVAAETQDTTPIWTTCLGVSTGSNYPRAAWEWIDFLSHQWLVQDQSQAWEISRAPARSSVAETVGYLDRLPENARPAVEYILAHSWSPRFFRESEAVNQALIDTLENQAEFVTALSEIETELAATPQPTPNTTPIVVATPKPTIDVASGATQVKFFTSNNGMEEDKMIERALESFNLEHPDLNVALSTDWDISHENIDDWYVYLAENFDCFSWYRPYWEQQNPTELLSLDALLQAEEVTFIQDFDPDQLASYRHEGALYGLPAVSQPQVIAYNTDLLARRGLEPPPDDWTIDDLADLVLAAASTAETDRSYGYIFSQWDNLFFDGLGIELVDMEADPPVSKFDDPEVLAALNWLVEMKQAGAFLISTDDNWDDINRAMGDGQVAFWSAQAGQLASWYFYDEEPPFSIGVAPYPQPVENGNLPAWSSERGYFISKQTENAQACWTLIKHLSEDSSIYLGVPARRSVAASPEWETLVGKENAEIYKLAVTRVNRTSEVHDFNPMEWPISHWRSNIVRAVQGTGELDKVLLETQAIIDSYLSCTTGIDTENLDDEEIIQQVSACARQVDPEGPWLDEN